VRKVPDQTQIATIKDVAIRLRKADSEAQSAIKELSRTLQGSSWLPFQSVLEELQGLGGSTGERSAPGLLEGLARQLDALLADAQSDGL
jgi:hypothetical protein